MDEWFSVVVDTQAAGVIGTKLTGSSIRHQVRVVSRDRQSAIMHSTSLPYSWREVRDVQISHRGNRDFVEKKGKHSCALEGRRRDCTSQDTFPNETVLQIDLNLGRGEPVHAFDRLRFTASCEPPIWGRQGCLHGAGRFCPRTTATSSASAANGVLP